MGGRGVGGRGGWGEGGLGGLVIETLSSAWVFGVCKYVLKFFVELFAFYNPLYYRKPSYRLACQMGSYNTSNL